MSKKIKKRVQLHHNVKPKLQLDEPNHSIEVAKSVAIAPPIQVEAQPTKKAEIAIKKEEVLSGEIAFT